jgi:hypothetical protein
MAVTTVVQGSTVFGNKRIVYGTYSSDNTGGDIETGLTKVMNITLTATGSSVVADSPTVNETMPCTGTVTVIVTSATTGMFMAIGK